MRDLFDSFWYHVRHIGAFLVSVIKDFHDNKGLLLAGGVGYNALLSIVPLFAVFLIVLSHFFEQQQLLTIVSTELTFLVPGYAEELTDAITTFVNQRDVVGSIVFLALLFFSSLAFRMLEDAIAIIFHKKHEPADDRSFWISALIPYVFILMLGLGLMALTSLTAFLDAIAGRTVTILAFTFSIAPVSGTALYLASIVGIVFLFTALYKVMPVVRIRLVHAFAGGLIAATLWEIVRRVVVWYFQSISLVNVVYGSLTTVVIVLLIMEIGAVIILLGAQAIAELKMNHEAGLPWYGELAKEEAETLEDRVEEEEPID